MLQDRTQLVVFAIIVLFDFASLRARRAITGMAALEIWFSIIVNECCYVVGCGL